MTFVLEFYEPHFDAIIAWTPDVQFGTAEAVVIVNDLIRRGTSVVLDPRIERRLDATPVVGRSLNMQQGYRT